MSELKTTYKILQYKRIDDKENRKYFSLHSCLLVQMHKKKLKKIICAKYLLLLLLLTFFIHYYLLVVTVTTSYQTESKSVSCVQKNANHLEPTLDSSVVFITFIVVVLCVHYNLKVFHYYFINSSIEAKHKSSVCV